MNRILLAIFLFAHIACSSPKKEKVQVPAHVLNRQKMIGLLLDIHIAEATNNLNTMEYAPQGQVPDSLTDDVLKKHGISFVQYTQSMEFYTRHPQLLDSMYTDVINEISKLQAEPGK